MITKLLSAIFLLLLLILFSILVLRLVCINRTLLQQSLLVGLSID